MKITWVTRSFLDYRIPVYKALDELCGHQLTLIYNGDVVPERCQAKAKAALGDRAIAMKGEIRIGNRYQLGVANKGIRIPIQRGLLSAIRKSNPDVVVSDGFFQWTYAPLLLKMISGKGIGHVMCYEKTPHTERNASNWRLSYRRFVSRWIDAIDCNGSLSEQFVRETLNYAKPITHGHMAADTDGMKMAVENSSAAQIKDIKDKFDLNGLTFIYVGRLIPLKGIMEMLKAWKAANLEDASLLLVGDGSQRDEVEKYVDSEGLRNVKLAGAVDYDSLGPYYAAADCFIIPTLEDNWSLVVPEAMAAGLPVACSIYNGCHPELVKPENGWTFDPLDCADTAGVLQKISSRRADLKRMGEASRRIVANHTPRDAARGIFEACELVLKK